MSVFESVAVLEDPRHLTLGWPVPEGLSRHCRVIVMFDTEPAAVGPEAWPQGFLEDIHIDDSAFERPTQGMASGFEDCKCSHEDGNGHAPSA